MRIHMPGMDATFDAAADLSTHQHKFVVAAPQSGTSQQCRVNVANATGRTIGILQNKPNAANLGAVVRLSGRSKLVVDGAAGAIVPGDLLIPDAVGRGIKGTGKVGAIALEASSAQNDIIDALVALME